MCPRCGMPYFDTSVINQQASPTQVERNTPQPGWQSPSLSPYPVTLTPPSAPPSHWITRLLVVQSVLIVGMLATLVVLLVRPSGGSSTSQQSVLGTATVTPTPVIQPTPLYAINLSSDNFNVFINALDDALAEHDIASIEPHTDPLRFTVDCGGVSPCDTGWYDLRTQLSADDLRLALAADANRYAPASSPCPDTVYQPEFIWAVGSFNNMTNMLLGHYGTATFGFETCCGGSSITYIWEALYFC